MSPVRLAPRTAVAATALALTLAAASASADDSSVKTPKSGATYSGKTEHGGKIAVVPSGKSIEIVAIQFRCDGSVGHTSLQDIPMKKTKRGYKFGITAYGNVTYDDDYPDENAKTTIWGRFGKKARSAHGHVQVRAPRCNTGRLDWRAHR
jgi:hypothetical protein